MRVDKKFVVPLILAAFFFTIAATSIRDKSNTTDEGSHMVRGIMLLKTADYRLNQHHPFLFNAINAIPAALNPQLETESLDSENWMLAKKDSMSSKLVELNGGPAEFSRNILYASRLTMIFAASVFLFFFYQIVKKVFSLPVAVVATSLLTLSPSVIAHSSLVTTDAPAMMTIFLATWALYGYLISTKQKRKSSLILFIVLSLVALLSKYTAVFAAFVWLLILAHHMFFVRKKGFKGMFSTLLIVIGGWILLLWAAYGFQLKTINQVEYNNPWFMAATLDHISHIAGNIKFISLSDFLTNLYYNLKLPFPQYIKGFYDNVFKHNFYGHSTYLFGSFSKTGWWYYFPAVFLVKESLTLVFLAILGVASGISKVVKKRGRLKYSPKLVFVIVPLFLLSLNLLSSLNLGIRHLLPVFPFLAILIGLTASEMIKKFKWFKSALIILLAANLISVLAQYPNYIEYFNEIAGGPQNGFRLVRDSNFDWGQNDGEAISYVQSHPNSSFEYEDVKDGGYWVVRVEDLFGNPTKRTPELEALRKEYEEGKVSPVVNLSHTFWVFVIE